MASAKTAPSLVPVKRPIRQLSVLEKLEAIERVHNGESKASVARDIGVPESTLRGWCKSEDKLRNVAQSCGGGGGTPDSQHSGGAAELAELDALVEQGTSGDHPAIKRMRTASDDEKASVAAVAAASDIEDSLWYWLKQDHQHVSNQLFAVAAADKLAAAAAAGAAVAAVANGGSGGGVAGGAASAAAPANAGWFWRWYKRYGYTQYPGDPLAALTAAPAPDLRAAGAALNGGGGGTASRSAALLDSVLLNNNNNLAAVAPAFNNHGNTNTSATTHHDQHNSGASNGTNANGSAGNNNGSSDEDDELDESDEPPATAAEAVTHGEKFLRWLECCSDPSITAMQILQFRYLLNNVRACADRRARQTKTKKARSRRK
ncbi:protein distal antenna-like [Schistocerca cancellata]|uniref:protein distal antenna-like n=1 Tax=Schistocerca cancellata TaxID=274614 RepID=UPI002117DABF|nr:protein distal antenna-like [Schistocerca cancellata]XP_049785262.1 protein distal antenna-like [Schistocerca cancellata]